MGTWSYESYSNDYIMEILEPLVDIEDDITDINIFEFLNELWEETLVLENFEKEYSLEEIENDCFGREKLGSVVYILENYPNIKVPCDKLKEVLFIAKYFLSEDIISEEGWDYDEKRISALKKEIQLIESRLN